MSEDGKLEGAADAQPSPIAELAELIERLRLPRALSRRELEIVDAAVRGLGTKATAADLDLSPKTVDEYWRRVYRKFRCTSRIEVLARLFKSANEAEREAPPLGRARRRR
jgi:DNA-binding NarL/FixJ family response regulator